MSFQYQIWPSAVLLQLDCTDFACKIINRFKSNFDLNTTWKKIGYFSQEIVVVI